MECPPCGCQTKIRQTEKNLGRTPSNKLDDLTASAKHIWAASTKKGRTLTVEDVLNLATQPCHYCKAPPSLHRPLGSGKWTRLSEVPTNGIDRKDSDEGYHIGNCVPCCTRCNLMKREIPYQDFIDLCKAIAENHS